MDNPNERCLLLYDELLYRKGVRRVKLTKKQLADQPYVLTCDSFYIGGNRTDEILVKGAFLMDDQENKDTVCLLAKDLKTDNLFIKVLNVKPDLSMSLDHIIKISYDRAGDLRHDFLQRKEALCKGSLSAFCKPPALQSVINYVTNSSPTTNSVASLS